MLTPWKKSFVIVAGLLAFSAGAQAQVCNTLQDCLSLLDKVNARIQELEEGSSSALGDIARNANGSINYMNQADAIKYCKSQGGHLPTARELAQALNPKGISNTDPKDGVSYLVSTTEGDKFYYNYKTYTRPQGDLGSNFFWSSSGYSVYPDDAYYFYGDYGFVDYVNRDNSSAVRCARGQ